MTQVPVSSSVSWLDGARPQTLVLSMTPVAVGVIYAHVIYGDIEAIPIIAALTAAILIQITTNLANDAADGGHGADAAKRLGPPRLVGSGAKSARQVWGGAVATSILAFACGAIAVAYGGLPIAAIGLASLLAAWGYSYGPWPISASPLGELFVVAFFGVVATAGTVWLAVHRIDATALLVGAVIGLPAAAVLTVNNHRDRAQDQAAGRRTLAILLGPSATVWLYLTELLAAAVLTAVALEPIHWSGTVVAAFAIGTALVLGRGLMVTPISRAMNEMLAMTVRYQLALAAGIIIVLLIRFAMI